MLINPLLAFALPEVNPHFERGCYTSMLGTTIMIHKREWNIEYKRQLKAMARTSVTNKCCLHCMQISCSCWYWDLAGLASFVLNVVAGVWIKYNPYSSISIAATACMGVAILYLLLLYSRWAPYLTGYTRRSRGQAYNVGPLPPSSLPSPPAHRPTTQTIGVGSKWFHPYEY